MSDRPQRNPPRRQRRPGPHHRHGDPAARAGAGGQARRAIAELRADLARRLLLFRPGRLRRRRRTIRWRSGSTMIAALSQIGLDRSLALVKPGALVVVDERLVPEPPQARLRCARPADQPRAAIALGSPRIANVVALGALARLAGLCADDDAGGGGAAGERRRNSPTSISPPRARVGRWRRKGAPLGRSLATLPAFRRRAPPSSPRHARTDSIEPGARKREDPQGAGGGLNSNSGFASSTSAFGSMRKSSASKGSCGR